MLRSKYPTLHQSTLHQSILLHQYVQTFLRRTLSVNELRNISFVAEDKLRARKLSDIVIIHHQYKTGKQNYCAFFPPTPTIIDLMQSFKENSIAHQLAIDFPRMRIYLNTKQCAKLSELYQFIRDLPASLLLIVLMMCTQVSFFYPFDLLYRLYTDHDFDLHIIHDNSPTMINIVRKEGELLLIFYKTFLLIDTTSKDTVDKLGTYMVISVTMRPEKRFHIPLGLIFWRSL